MPTNNLEFPIARRKREYPQMNIVWILLENKEYGEKLFII